MSKTIPYSDFSVYYDVDRGFKFQYINTQKKKKGPNQNLKQEAPIQVSRIQKSSIKLKIIFK